VVIDLFQLQLEPTRNALALGVVDGLAFARELVDTHQLLMEPLEALYRRAEQHQPAVVAW
jgi:hypothetical protein